MVMLIRAGSTGAGPPLFVRCRLGSFMSRVGGRCGRGRARRC
jgi:hypothetical protein